jgi:hypothetical protein
MEYENTFFRNSKPMFRTETKRLKQTGFSIKDIPLILKRR